MTKRTLTVTIAGETYTKTTKVAYTHVTATTVTDGRIGLAWHRDHAKAVRDAENCRAYQEDLVAFLEGRESLNRYSANLCGTAAEERAIGNSIKVYAID